MVGGWNFFWSVPFQVTFVNFRTMNGTIMLLMEETPRELLFVKLHEYDFCDFLHINWCRISPINFIHQLSPYYTRWWFQIFFFHPYLGKIPNLTNIFQMGCKPPTSIGPPWSCVCLQSIVPQGWFLDECPWFAGCGRKKMALGREENEGQLYIKSAYNKTEWSYLWGGMLLSTDPIVVLPFYVSLP